MQSCARSATFRKNSKMRRFVGLASAARTMISVSAFSHCRGGASAIVGPISRTSRRSVSGFSGKLTVNPTCMCTASENSELPTQAIGR